MESQRGKPNTASSYSKFNNAHIKVMLFCLIIGVFSLLPSIVYYNGVFLFRDDFIQQQVPFILETKRMLLGDIPFWSWNTFLGDNFIGSYAFYTIGSPFVWLILPLKEQLIPLGITLSILLKFMISGLTSYLYLRLFVKKDANINRRLTR